MTRINTNVNSLVAQTRLSRTQADLQTSLTRLSTGLRINTGKDDPAGLIASESLRSDITSINKALSNTQRANQIISTADSALGQVSSLLNDVRGLVTEAANKGALSDEEIAANQLQVDSSLEAINRIAQTTTFQGRRLLDGSLDFTTKAGAGFSTVADLKIDQANLGATGSIAVEVNISAAATKAAIQNTGIAASTTAVNSTGTLTFGTPTAALESSATISLANAYQIGAEAVGTVTLTGATTPNAEAGTGAFTLNLGSGVALQVTAKDGTIVDGTAGNLTTIRTVTTTSGAAPDAAASYNSTTHELTLTLKEGATGAQVATALAADTLFTFASVDATTVTNADNNKEYTQNNANSGPLFSGGTDTTANATFVLSAVNGGQADGAKGNSTQIRITNGSSNTASYDATANLITVTKTASASVNDIVATINSNLSADFNAGSQTLGSYKFAPTLAATTATSITAGTDPTVAGSFKLTAINGGLADGLKGDSTRVNFTLGTTNTTNVTYDSANNRLNVEVGIGATVGSVATAIDTNTRVNNVVTNVFQATNVLNGTSLFKSTGGTNDLGLTAANLFTGGTNSSLSDVITVTADTASSAFDKTITVQQDNAITAGTAQASLDNSGNIVVKVRNTGTVQVSTIKDAINSLDGYSASITTNNGDGTYDVVNDTAPTIVNLANGNAGGGLASDLVVQLTGGTGSEVFNFKSGTTLTNIVQSINLVKDATGVEALNDAGTLRLSSTGFGSEHAVAVEVISEGVNGTFKTGLSAARANGTDIQATVNGFAATGSGNTLSVNTATLDLSLTVSAGSSSAIKFDISGGGAQFQLGPDVVSNQQARLGIGSLNTAKLGSANGRLYELASGGSKSLVNDATGASKVINDVISKVTTLRGRLGAFQRTTLDSNSVSLSETLSNLNEAQSSIRDADFAKESANLTRAQILVQSGTQVLSLANSAPQNVLSLLR